MIGRVPARRKEMFYCATAGGGCSKYFATYLRKNHWGNYTIECPNCGHHHYRFIDNGLVTQDRHNERAGTAEIIVGLKSTLSDVPDMELEKANLKLYQGGLS